MVEVVSSGAEQDPVTVPANDELVAPVVEAASHPARLVIVIHVRRLDELGAAHRTSVTLSGNQRVKLREVDPVRPAEV
jgi:hypothetical protein